MILVEATYGGTMYYLSLAGYALTHDWKKRIISIDPIQYQLSSLHGGYDRLSVGSITISPEQFASGVPPTDIDPLTVKRTATTEAAAITLFAGTARLKEVRVDGIVYALKPTTYDVDLLATDTGYDGETTVLPRAFGEVIHRPAKRLADVSGFPTFHKAHIGGTLAKGITSVADNGSSQPRFTCPSHGFSTSDQVTVEVNDFSLAYNAMAAVTQIDSNTFDVTSWSYIGGGVPSVIDSYSEAHYNTIITVGDGDYKVAQAFNLPAAKILTGFRAYIRKEAAGSTGTITFALYACGGTPGSSGTPTGSALASNTYALADLSTSFSVVEVLFSSSYSAAAGNYCIVIEYTGSSPNRLIVGYDSMSPTHPGNFAYYDTSWHMGVSDSDLIFYLLADSGLSISGHAHKTGYWRVYDDGVPISGNVTDNGDGTFSLSAEPAGEVTISGTGEDTTLDGIFEFFCGASYLNLTFDNTYAESPTPSVVYWADSQQRLTDFLADLAGYFSQLFYVSGTTLYLVDVGTNNGTRALTIHTAQTPKYSYPDKAALMRAKWDSRSRVEELVGKYIKTTDKEAVVTSSYSDGQEIEIKPFQNTISAVETRITEILNRLNGAQITIPFPMPSTLPVPGEQITMTETGFNVSTDLTMRVRDIQFTFEKAKELITVSGDGTVAAT